MGKATPKKISDLASDPATCLPQRLVMHGVPESWINHATLDQLRVMWEVVKKDLKYQTYLTAKDQARIMAKGIALAFGGEDS
ncbi:hypothetical protein [Lactobacillus crispatus]|uniref:hypothetical protein n=1 Tax=Lactobacillus crispatus TaxID=47770 RepID=UPI001F088FE0|nr:hypothetical protein [Lactobacillus crispatus]